MLAGQLYKQVAREYKDAPCHTLLGNKERLLIILAVSDEEDHEDPCTAEGLVASKVIHKGGSVSIFDICAHISYRHRCLPDGLTGSSAVHKRGLIIVCGIDGGVCGTDSRCRRC